MADLTLKAAYATVTEDDGFRFVGFVEEDDEGYALFRQPVEGGAVWFEVNDEEFGDDEALAAFHRLTRSEGILPALESSHAVAQAIKLAEGLPKDALVLCNLSGRGDKDVHTIAAREGLAL